MRLTQKLCAQNLGFMFKKHWLQQGKRIPIETGAHQELESQGKQIVDATDLVKLKPEKIDIKVIGRRPPAVVWDETHPLWNTDKCYKYCDSHALIQGMAQAQVLTKTIVVNELPEVIADSVQNMKISTRVDRFAKTAILTANVFDSEQKKLAKIKDPLRPAFNFPRVYGITDTRRCQLLVSKLINECEKQSNPKVTLLRQLITDAQFVVPCTVDDNKILFDVTVMAVLVSKKPLSLNEKNVELADKTLLPDIFPLSPTVSIPTTNFYEWKEFFPVTEKSSYSNIHTVFHHYTPDNVKNMTEIPVNDDQKLSHSMMKAFIAAASKAKMLYGTDVKELPQPVVVQSIQTDGKSFYFGVYQLNSLDLTDSNKQLNVWYQTQPIDLYGECGYKDGRPILLEYNNQALKHLIAFYNNDS